MTLYNIIKKSDILSRMINYTKKWWLLGCHRRAEKKISTTGSNNGRPVLLAQKLFIEGNIEGGGEWKGLISKDCTYAGFFSSFLFRWGNEYNEEKQKRKRNEYYYIYEICREEGYISTHKETRFPTVTNSKANRMKGFPLGYFQGLLSDYDKVWIAIGGLIGSFIAGGYLLG